MSEDKITFNEKVHVADENGDPKRNAGGEIQLKSSWKSDATDRQGRKHNPKIHGKEIKLDAEGYLTLKRRDPNRARPNTSRSEALVAKHYEAGYAYYLANDDNNRVEQMISMDWEPVMDGKGAAGMEVGQARNPNTQGRLFRKPQEWYDADQREKRKQNDINLTNISSPKEELGQYEATDPLR